MGIISIIGKAFEGDFFAIILILLSLAPLYISILAANSMASKESFTKKNKKARNKNISNIVTIPSQHVRIYY